MDIPINGTGLTTIACGLYQTHDFCNQPYFWRPLANLSSRLFYGQFGVNPLPYHALDLIIHSLNALLVYYIAIKLSKDKVVALGAGLMFAAFYCHVGLLFGGGIYYESGCTLFCLLAIASFLNFQDTNRSIYLAASLSSVAIALTLKETALAAFPILLVLDSLYRPHPLPRIHWGLILCLTGLMGTYFAARIYLTTSPVGGITTHLATVPFLGPHKLFKQVYRGLYWTIANICPGKDLSGLFYLGFALFIWKAKEYRRLAITTGLLVACSVIPICFTHGIAKRYLYLSSALSVIFLAIVIRYSARALADRIMPSRPNAAEVLTGAALLTILSFNIYKIHTFETYYREAGCLLWSNIADVVATFPNGTGNFKLCLINTPIDLPHSKYGIQVWEREGINYALSLFFKGHSIPNVIQFTTDLGYPLPNHQWKITKIISNEELDIITKDPNNKVMVFNPHTRHLEDVTGKTSEEIKAAIDKTRG